MNEHASPEIQQLARGMAEDVAGPGAVKEVEVVETLDSHDRPAYLLSVLIESPDAWQRIGTIRIGLRMQLGDALVARGDPHRLLLQTLDRRDWSRLHA